MIPRYVVRIGLFLYCLGCFTILTGCWDTKDINKRLMPVVMGICKKEQQPYKIILQIPSPQMKGSQFLEGQAETINKAVDGIRTKSEKGVDLLHLRLFLICEELAKKDIENIVNYTIQANDISVKGLVGIVRGDFEKMMHHKIQANPELSSYDFFSEQAGWTPNNTIIRLWEVYRDMNSYTRDMAIPILSKGTDTLYNFEGSAIMRRDRMVGDISPEETLIYNTFQRKYIGGTIEVAGHSSVLIKKATISHHVKWTASGPSMKSRMKLNVVVAENERNLPDDVIAKLLKKDIEKKAAKLIKRLHEQKADVLGIGQYFRRIMTEKQMKSWKKQWFPQMEHEVTVDINILDNIYFKSSNKMKSTPVS
ncbi:putative spore germination protein YfkR [Paenibacillus baekrokdamisoli]|uniref:Putative spore germination protein YfkR n=1 Tax=Paenibacillus baekrokdamisoli TaxID=1712516 RepID=A0A3G9JL07_9BACL|nr:Ger(x)C family spore germination protein [Paenibacillus baekrokdamisoli]MBB3068762.1 Ger(x)C family germination protein [Paenibacillus baekrokdamisoli]BBH23594.1 putative spore germination protein YfkR [Paenibacillus baekrokdamisoli]